MYLFYFLKSYKNEEHSYKNRTANAHHIFFMNAPDKENLLSY
jgi:hypothetical protein